MRPKNNIEEEIIIIRTPDVKGEPKLVLYTAYGIPLVRKIGF